jgi:pyrroline-5-carboxylate reductase
MSNYRLGFIGAGKLAGSLIRGLVRSNYCQASEIIASEPNEMARESLEREMDLAWAATNLEVAEKAPVIFIGVKPFFVLAVLREIAAHLEGRLLISLAAGVRLPVMESAAPGARILRALTNTPSTVCAAATAIAAGANAQRDDINKAREIFQSVGVVVEVGEEKIDAVTALSGSGPAFVYTVIEALGKGGEKMGLSPDEALTLATQTVLGAAQLARETGLSPEELRRMVVTPGGTTAAGLAVMEEMKTPDGLIAAVEAAAKRGQEMARENS